MEKAGSCRAPLTLIVLSDGPSHPSSWKPLDDTTQWWSRRDALVRITAASLWKERSSSYQSSDTVVLLFNEIQERGDNASSASSKDRSKVDSGDNSSDGAVSVLILHSGAVTAAIPIPTEYALLSAFKASFTAAQSSRNLRRFHSSCNGGIECCANLCVATVSGDRLANISICATGNKPAISSSPSLVGAASLLSQVNTANKRDLLRVLQSSCPIDFLRKYGLIGSEDLVLKKKNLLAVRTAFDEWVKTSTTTTNNNNGINSNCSGGSSCAAEQSGLLSKLKHAMLVLLTKLKNQRQGVPIHSTCSGDGEYTVQHVDHVLLLLHEDYPVELPVFGDNSDSEYHGGGGTIDCNNSNHSNSNSSDNPSSGGKNDCIVNIMCVMGGVRDVSPEEEVAIIMAAHELGIRVVGANLGRTAEFTSKIITALSAHNVCGRLVRAVQRLPPIDTSTIVNSSCGSSSSSAEYLLQKLRPVRGWTWTGKEVLSSSSSSSSSTTTRATLLLPSSLSSLPSSISASMSLKRRAPELANDMDNSASTLKEKRVKLEAITSTDAVQTAVIRHRMSFAVWVDMLASDVTSFFGVPPTSIFSINTPSKSFISAQKQGTGQLLQQQKHQLSMRDNMYDLVQIIVNALWRSRIVSEVDAVPSTSTCNSGSSSSSSSSNCRNDTPTITTSTSKSNGGSSGTLETEAAPVVVPELYLIFTRDGSILRLAQRDVASAMAGMHMAVPSEYQVLRMLEHVLGRPESFVVSPSYTCYGSSHGSSGKALSDTTSLEHVLGHILPTDLTKEERKRFKVVDLIDVGPVSSTSAAATASVAATSKTAAGRAILADWAYSKVCSCLQESSLNYSTGGSHSPNILFLFRDNNARSSEGSYTPPAVFNVLYSWLKGNSSVFEGVTGSSLPTAADKVMKKTANLLLEVSLLPRESILSCSNIACGKAIAVLQHWAYHNRLFPAIEAAGREETLKELDAEVDRKQTKHRKKRSSDRYCSNH